MQQSKLLLTGYQFSSVRIPIQYVVELRGFRLVQGSQTRGTHVGREGLLCGLRCFWEFSSD